jgi:hypothetical protein
LQDRNLVAAVESFNASVSLHHKTGMFCPRWRRSSTPSTETASASPSAPMMC